MFTYFFFFLCAHNREFICSLKHQYNGQAAIYKTLKLNEDDNRCMGKICSSNAASNTNMVLFLVTYSIAQCLYAGECVSVLFIVPESRCVFLSSHTLLLFSGGLSLSVVPAPAAVTVDEALRRDEE